MPTPQGGPQRRTHPTGVASRLHSTRNPHVELQLHRRVRRLQQQWSERLGVWPAIDASGARLPWPVPDKLDGRLDIGITRHTAVAPHAALHRAAPHRSKPGRARAFSQWVLPRCTLEAAVHAAVMDLRVGHSQSVRIFEAAFRRAHWAAQRDRSARVCATFAVLCVIPELGDGLMDSFQGLHRWRDGVPLPLTYTGKDGVVEITPPNPTDVPVGAADVASLKALRSPLGVAREFGIVDCDWEPSGTRSGDGLYYWADYQRPPAEAYRLISDVFHRVEPMTDATADAHMDRLDSDDFVREAELDLDAMVEKAEAAPMAAAPTRHNCLAFGFTSAGVQLLSACLGAALSVRDWSGAGTRPRPRRPYSLIVIKMARPYLPDGIDQALSFSTPGTKIVLLSDPADHHEFRGQIEDANLQAHPHLDTSNRAVLLRYANRPWAPSDVPPASRKLMSIWRVPC